MVATRNHPRDFSPVEESPAKPSPTKRTTRASKAAAATDEDSASIRAPSSPLHTPTSTTFSRTSMSTTRRKAWTHTPSNLTLIWLAISLPLVIWDTGYILLRPHTMEGGFLHWPLYVPYELYAVTDYMYGLPALERHDGWPSAQGVSNAIETIFYLVYLYIVYAYGEQEPIQGRGAPDKSLMGQLRGLSEARTLEGRQAAIAVLICYSAALFTFGKTILYWLIEFFSGFEATGHNSAFNWITLFAIPNLPWIFIPGYIMYVQGAEILQGLETATAGGKKDR